MAAVRAYCVSEITQNVTPLPFAGLSDSEQAGSGDFAVAAAVAETDLPPLDGRAQDSFAYIVGRFHLLVFQKREQPFEVNEQRRSHVAHLAVGIIQVRLRQREQFLLQGNRFFQELPPVQELRISAPVSQVAAEPIPKAEQPGHNSQRVPAKLP